MLRRTKFKLPEKDPLPPNMKVGKYLGDCPSCHLVICTLDKKENTETTNCPRCGKKSSVNTLLVRKPKKDLDIDTWTQDRRDIHEYEKRLQSRMPTVGPEWFNGIRQEGDDQRVQCVPEGTAEGSGDGDNDPGTIRQPATV